jgi:Xaa-Pro aminopeptidase
MTLESTRRAMLRGLRGLAQRHRRFEVAANGPRRSNARHMPNANSRQRRGIPLLEYAARRQKVAKALGGAAAAVVLAGEGAPPLLGQWRPDFHFLYLTGIDDEPGAAVLFDPSAEDPKRRCVLFLRSLDVERERWDGYRQPIGTPLREGTGFQTVMRSGALAGLLTAAARRTKRLACLHALSVYPSPVSPDLAVFKQVAERVPGTRFEDRSELMPSLRAIKSPAELALMKKAVEATVGGYAQMLRMLRPGVSEADVDHALTHGYLAGGGSGVAYNSIVGSGLNGTVLHYMANNAQLEAGDLLVIDSAAEYLGYTSDVTRTFPVSGKFTPDQREVYEIVLRAQLAAIKALRPGARMIDADAAARGVIEKAGYGDSFIHGVGHPLGLQVHDVIPDHPLKPGMVVTIEPGIYLPERKMGVRIEDDLLITARGSQNLTAAIPKTVAEVEAAMGK